MISVPPLGAYPLEGKSLYAGDLTTPVLGSSLGL